MSDLCLQRIIMEAHNCTINEDESTTPFIREATAAVDFMNALDPSRYSDFKADLINDAQRGVIELPNIVLKSTRQQRDMS